jgi:hypothetical protein
MFSGFEISVQHLNEVSILVDSHCINKSLHAHRHDDFYPLASKISDSSNYLE